MVTLGVDLASQAKKTAACRIRWDGKEAHVDCLRIGLEDSDLLELFGCPGKGPDKIGIDAPFGWPVDFARAIHCHSTSMRWPYVDVSRLRLRRTDHFVRQETGKVPLAVAADKIAMTAFRVARLLAQVSEAGEDVDRSGDNFRFVEVYPAAALRKWGYSEKGLKGKGPEKEDKRDELVCALARKARLTLTEEVGSGFRKSDDKFDALVAALVARVAAIPRCCEPIPEEDRPRARKEGWIALPRSDSLGRLATTRPDS